MRKLLLGLMTLALFAGTLPASLPSADAQVVVRRGIRGTVPRYRNYYSPGIDRYYGRYAPYYNYDVPPAPRYYRPPAYSYYGYVDPPTSYYYLRPGSPYYYMRSEPGWYFSYSYPSGVWVW